MSLDVASEIGERTSVFITTALNTGVRYYHWHCRGLGNDDSARTGKKSFLTLKGMS
jgi:hypothetical protein